MNKNRFFIYCTVFLIMGLSNSVIPVLPEIAARGFVSSDSLEYTLLFSGYFIGALLTMIPFGLLSDTHGSMKLICFAVTFTFLAGIVLTISSNIYLLIAARLIEGIACGAFFPPAYATLSNFNERSRYIGEFNFLLNAGLAFGVLSSGFLAAWSIRGAIVMFTVISFVLLLFGSSFLFSQKKPDRVQTKQFSHFSETKKVFSKMLDMKFMRIWVTAFLIFGITGVILAFYSEYSKDMLTKPELGLAIGILYISSMATNLVVGRMNLDCRKMISTGIILAAAGVFISLKHPFLGFTLLGIGSGTGMIGLPIAVSHMPFDRGMAMGIFNTYTYAGLALMPIIAGLFTDLGYPMIFALTSLILLISLFLKDGSYAKLNEK